MVKTNVYCYKCSRFSAGYATRRVTLAALAPGSRRGRPAVARSFSARRCSRADVFGAALAASLGWVTW